MAAHRVSALPRLAVGLLACLLLAGCSALEPTEAPSSASRPAPWPPQAVVEVEDERPRAQEPLEFLRAYFLVPKPKTSTIAERLEARSEFLTKPEVDFFYPFREVEDEVPSEEHLSRLLLREGRFKKDGSLVVPAAALYVGYEQPPSGSGEQPFHILWAGQATLKPVEGGWKIAALTYEVFDGGAYHPTQGEFEEKAAQAWEKLDRIEP